MKKYLLFALVLIMLVMSGCEGGGDDVKNGRGLFGGKDMVVGKTFEIDDIKEFYYTVEDINYDAFYQRYKFYKEDGKYYLFHETRERKGDYGPCTENDTTAKGTLELTDDQWEEFYDLILDGKVTERKDDGSSGDSGPWYYLYWKGDKDKYQEFSFASGSKESGFEEYCLELVSKTAGSIDLSGEPEIEITEFYYNPGYSDMDGGYHSRVLSKNNKGEWEFLSRDCDSYEEPETSTVYAVSEEDLKRLEMFIQQIDLEAISKREDSDDFLTDYRPWGISIRYIDLKTGNKTEYRLEEYKEYTKTDYEIIDELEELFYAVRGEKLSETVEDE